MCQLTSAPVDERGFGVHCNPSAFSLDSKNRFFWQDKRNGF
jgi:hypothetical protein